MRKEAVVPFVNVVT